MSAAAGQVVNTFEGFSDDALQFLLELQAEQSRTWFKAHQTDYTRLIRQPLELLVEAVRARLVDVWPGLAEVEPHYFRIQRDTRFSRDKTPYKSWVAAQLPIRPVIGDHEDHATPGLYLSYGLDGQYVGAGSWHMSSSTLAQFRSAVADDRLGARLQSVIDGLQAEGWSLSSIETLKRVPQGFAADHPRAELLKRKGLAMSSNMPAEQLSSAELVGVVESRYRRVAPLVDWLDETLAPRG